MHFFIQGLSPASARAFNVNFSFLLFRGSNWIFLKVGFTSEEVFIISSFKNNFHSEEVRDIIDVNDFETLAPS